MLHRQCTGTGTKRGSRRNSLVVQLGTDDVYARLENRVQSCSTFSDSLFSKCAFTSSQIGPTSYCYVPSPCSPKSSKRLASCLSPFSVVPFCHKMRKALSSSGAWRHPRRVHPAALMRRRMSTWIHSSRPDGIPSNRKKFSTNRRTKPIVSTRNTVSIQPAFVLFAAIGPEFPSTIVARGVV